MRRRVARPERGIVERRPELVWRVPGIDARSGAQITVQMMLMIMHVVAIEPTMKLTARQGWMWFW